MPAGFHLCTRNVHRVLLATTLVSAKLVRHTPCTTHRLCHPHAGPRRTPLVPRRAPARWSLACRLAHCLAPSRVAPSARLAVSLSQLDDECYNNTYWASVGGVSLPHLNQLEVEVVSLLNFSLLVNAQSLEAARHRLLASA